MVLQRIILVQIVSSFYVVLQKIVLVEMEVPVLRLFYKESYWYKSQLQCLCGSTKNNTGTNGGSSVYVVLQRIILVQIVSSFYVVLQRIVLVEMEVPVLRLFYKESYWYKSQLQCLCGSTKNNTGTNRYSRV